MSNQPHRYSLIEHLLFPPTWLSQQKLARTVHNKTILITGATFGIGEQLAYLLAPSKPHLVLVARTQKKLEEVGAKVENLGCTTDIFVTDLTKQDQLDELLKFLHSMPQGIDIVISNAGKSIRRSIHDSLDRYHDFTRTMNLNYFAPVRLLLSLIPILEKNDGHIINVSAINVLMIPPPFWAAYQASKSAFDQWFRCVGLELASRQINSTSIYLPLVKTRMIEPTKAYRSAPAMSAKHVAKTIAKTLYTKRRTHAPWWLFFGELGSLVLRKPLEWALQKWLSTKQKNENQ